MSRAMLKNYCIEPTMRSCKCIVDVRCGGIVEPSVDCPEHSARPGLTSVMKTHIHPIQGPPVGTRSRSRYDAAAS